jgi:polyisoprenyl-teichoic acid--peptidoglycan teichoic acid transferase
MMSSTRAVKRGKKKRKKILLAFLVVFLVILGIGGYSVFQYYQGLKMANEDINNEIGGDQDKEDVEFNGVPAPDGKTNVLLLGIDTRGEEKSRTDTIMIAQYDSDSHQPKIVSIMRDTYVEIPGHQNYKINTAYFLGGPELLRQTIKHNFGIDIQYYAIIDFKGFEKSVDVLAPKGIEIDVEKAMGGKEIGVTLEPGLQTLDGEELLGYARFRKDYEGDFGRVRRQQQVVNALKEELISFSGLAKLPKMVGTVQPYIDTNMSTKDVLGIISDYMLNPSKDVKTMTVPVKDSFWDASYSHAGAVLEIDFQKNIEELQSFLHNGSNQSADNTSEEQAIAQ